MTIRSHACLLIAGFLSAGVLVYLLLGEYVTEALRLPVALFFYG